MEEVGSGTEPNNTGHGYFSSIYDDWGPSKIFAAFVFALTQTLGNALLAGIVWYEKYGSDSFFRTIINQVGNQ